MQSFPHSMNSTSTHDTKRSEDVRARLNVLSEIPNEWRECLFKWNSINMRHKVLRKDPCSLELPEKSRDNENTMNSSGKLDLWIPDRNFEYLFYQTLIGVWPFGALEASDDFIERVKQCLLKSAKEAKLYTSWTNPDSHYEENLLHFIECAMRDKEFLESFLPLQQLVAHFGIWNSLSQVVIKLMCPGVPDIYQGCELWDFSLVDPDNRRPVDFGVRYHRLKYLQTTLKRHTSECNHDLSIFLNELLTNVHDGSIKLFVTERLLDLRKRKSTLFSEGSYVPLPQDANAFISHHRIAFSRILDHDCVVVVAQVGSFLSSLFESSKLSLNEGSVTCASEIMSKGKELWSEQYVRLLFFPMAAYPPKSSVKFRDIFTGTEYEIKLNEEGIAESSLSLVSLFSRLPVSVLEIVQ